MKKLIAIWLTKLLILAGRICGKESSSSPALPALKICPDIIRLLSSQLRCGVIAVCGTNGKTTTNNMLSSLLEQGSKRVVCNSYGANMQAGVATALIASASWLGKLNADYATMEVDELSTIKVFPHLQPDFMLITNLFRDQLDRYGEIDLTLSYLKKGLDSSPKTRLILNADDPLLAAFGKESGRECIWYGIGEESGNEQEAASEGKFCTFCGKELVYDYHHYSQLGNYRCECGFARPEPQYDATDLSLEEGISFTVKDRTFSVPYRGFYNVYNILAAYAAAAEIGADVSRAQEAFDAYRPQVGRMETFMLGGKKLILNLAKNPAGFNQAISTVMTDSAKKSVIIAINDKANDGKDITWLWDVNFEALADENTLSITAGGMRYLDLYLRLKYGSIGNIRREESMETAIRNALAEESEVVYLLANYTALYSTETILKGWKE